MFYVQIYSSEGGILLEGDCAGPQCGQMVTLLAPNLATHNDANLPNTIKIVQKWAENFFQNQINLK